MTATDASAALAAIRAREQAATPGPWFGPGKPCPTDGWTMSVAVVGEHHVGARPCREHDATESADAEFIAHARTDVPRMAAALDAVLALCDEAERAASGRSGVLAAYAAQARKTRALLDRHATTGATP